ncbi:MAG: hypothetical protein B7Y25_02315 [Alphaproteobacteria bacterium 16-39-46]|nr:MAG: hypothetical protein B7Y25_02315 [Alphaproteobacteria bacterium 16-39-46]OZA43600.1 MAG: hypothetical protein B7X84_02820 [Alphaproteobacteria bacterium 17-39-52]
MREGDVDLKKIVCIEGRLSQVSYEDFLLTVLEALWKKEDQNLKLFEANRKKFKNFSREVQRGKLDKDARDHLDQIKERKKRQEEEDAKLARERIEQEMIEIDKKEKYLEVLRLDLNNSEALNELAKIAMRHGNLREAESYYKKAFEVNPTSISMKGLIDVADRLKENMSEKSYLGELINDGYQDEEMFNRLSKILLEESERNPENVVALVYLASMRIMKGRNDIAELYLEQALARDPNNVIVLGCLGEICCEEKRFRESRIYLRRAFSQGSIAKALIFPFLDLRWILEGDYNYNSTESYLKKVFSFDQKNYLSSTNFLSSANLKAFLLEAFLKRKRSH